MRFALTATTALSLLAISAAESAVPRSWSDADLPQQPVRYYGVEVARFPSSILAGGVEESLQRYSWGPVIRMDTADGVRIVVGETTSIGEAHLLREELILQGISDGRIVIIPPSASAAPPRGVSREPFMPAFLPSGGAPPITLVEATEKLRAITSPDSDDQQQTIALLIEALTARQRENPILGNGGLEIGRAVWEKREDPELALALLSPIARGEWASTEEERRTAQTLVADILYEHRRDWHAAYRAAAEVAASHPSARERSAKRLRMVALSAELIQRGAEPAPTIPTLRARLRSIAETLPPNENRLQAKVDLFYLQTFAWEGNWTRVEEIARVYLEDHTEFPVYTAIAKTYLAQSLERLRDWDQGLTLLQEVMDARLDSADFPRLGSEVRDPRDAARLLHRHFMAMRSNLDPLDSRPATPQESEAAAPTAAQEPQT